MRGKRTSEVDKEKVKAVLYLNPDASHKELANTVNLPESTVRGIRKEIELTDEFADVRTKKKEEFIDKAWEVVGKALELTNKRFTKALEDEEAIEGLIESLQDNEELSKTEVNALARKLKDLQMTNIRDVAVALGTIYDKQALASGEPTQISESKQPLDKLIQDYDKALDKYKKLIAN